MTRPAYLAWMLLLCACSSGDAPLAAGDIGFVDQGLSPTQRRERAGQIRDAAAANGLMNGWMLAGIADAETNMSHCWSEATWACQGPTHSDCGGPIIAGSADGPCSARQGGLGMFQFDAGTYDQTLAREGDRILSIAGNTAAAVDFTVDMVIRSTFINGVDSRDQAIAWMNQVQVDGTQWTEWIQTVVRYYNGCSPTSACWTERNSRYAGKTRDVFSEMGSSFWATSTPPVTPPVTPPTGPPFAAQVVSQSFPSPTIGWSLAAGEQFTGYFELRNDGTETWRPGTTFLVTTNPRDGASLLAALDWLAPNRPTTVDRDVPPGGTGRFVFTIQSPTAGQTSASQFFNVSQNGTYFDPPGDNAMHIQLGVLQTQCPAGVGPSFSCAPLGGRHRCVSGIYEQQPCPNGCDPVAPEATCRAGTNDFDGDGYAAGVDCDDSNTFIYPGQADTCGDGIDANCDGYDDCASTPPPVTPPPSGSPDAGYYGAGPAGGTTLSSGCAAAPGAPGGWLLMLWLALLAASRRSRR